MRRLLVVAGLVIVVAGAASAYWVTKHRFASNVHGSSSGFVKTETVAPPAPKPGIGVVSPMFGGVPEHLHVGTGHVRPPFRRAWTSGGTALVEFPPALAFHYLYYAAYNGNFIALSTRNGQRLWTMHVGRCQASSPAVSRRYGGTVFETFLNRLPCTRGVSNPADGLLLAVAAGRSHEVRWQRNLGASETSPTIFGNRIYVGTAEGNVYSLRADNGKTVWQYHVGAPVKGAIAYDHGKVFFGAYDGNLYALGANSGKLIWRASSANPIFGSRGRFYSTPAVANSRVYLGSTDGNVYSFDEKTGALAWSRATGGYVYGSPAVWGGRVFIGSYSHTFYALNAATGDVLWEFHAAGPISGSGTVIDGIVYFATLGTRRTYGLDVRTGRLVWTLNDGGFGPIVTDGKKLYVIGWGKVYAFSPRHRS